MRIRTHWIDLRTGPVSSGKTEEAVRFAKLAVIGGGNVFACKATADNERGKGRIVSKSGIVLEDVNLIPRATPGLIRDALKSFESENGRADIILIDETQWFSAAMPPLVLSLREAGYHLVIVGLDLDFRGEPFGYMSDLYPYASEITKHHGICYKCKEHNATHSQRLMDGAVAPWEGQIIQEGGLESYQPVCFHDYVRPPRTEYFSPNGREALHAHHSGE